MYQDIHQSGRFDATTAQRHGMNQQIRSKCSMGLITEYHGLQFFGRQWRNYGDEALIVWNADRWDMHYGGILHITTPRWRRGTDIRHSVAVTWALLGDGHGWTVLRFGGHLPAHLFKPSQNKANVAALRGMPRQLKPIIQRTKPDEISGSFDFNRELRLVRNQNLINQSFAPLDLRLRVPPGTTHHPMRRIDGFVTDKHSDGMKMLDWRSGYDHRGVQRQSTGE